MDVQDQAAVVRYRKKANDIYFTPEALAKKCIGMLPITHGDVLLDPAVGKGAFLNNFPSYTHNTGIDICQGEDFLEYNKPVDWCVTNPPYSILNEYLKKSIKLCRKGFAYLVGSYSITPKRLEMCKDAGFGLYSIHMCKVSRWFGMTVFVIFEKDYDGSRLGFTYDRKPYNIGYSRKDKNTENK